MKYSIYISGDYTLTNNSRRCLVMFFASIGDMLLMALCRVLYGNKITEISKGLFEGLFSLQLL